MVNTIMVTTQTAILACWVIFCLYWLLSALSTKPTQEVAEGFNGLWYRVSLVAGAVLIGNFFQVLSSLGLMKLVIPRTSVVGAVSIVLAIVGLIIAIWARRTLASNWSANITYKKDHELITSGPYHYVRHPIYTGILAMVLGTILAVGTVGAVIGLVLIVISMWLKWRQEEELMGRHFPKEYPDYKKRTKAILPLVL
jgi:protein-S-isoprenylcysteine O-methyltransferase Ste14